MPLEIMTEFIIAEFLIYNARPQQSKKKKICLETFSLCWFHKPYIAKLGNYKLNYEYTNFYKILHLIKE